MSDLSINSLMPIKSITAIEWLDTDAVPDVIDAPWVVSVTTTGRRASTTATGIRGDFQADLVLTGASVPFGKATLGTVNIAGDLLSGSQWDVRSGYAGSVTIKGTADHALIRVAGNITNITIGASDGSVFGAGVGFDLLLSDGHVAVGDVGHAPTGTIKTFTVTGWKIPVGQQIPRFFIDSDISAKIGKLKLLNWDGLGGLYAPSGSVRSVIHKDTANPANDWVWPPTELPSGPNGFVHII